MAAATASVGQRMATGVVWVVGSRLLVRLLGVISTLILARLLQPSDYGLIALATAFAAAVELLGAFNFDVWLVRHRSPSAAHYDTVWTLSLLRGVVIAVILFVAAEGVAVVFSEPRLTDVLRVLALGTLAASITNVGITDFQRDLRFDREFAYLGIAKFGSFLVAVVIAVWLRTYWALLAGIVAGQLLRVYLSFRLSPYRPRWSLLHWREVFGFSKWLLAGNVFGFAYLQSGTFILGRLSGADSVGFYMVAREISDLASSEIIAPIRRVLLPGYANLHNDTTLLQRSFIDGFGLIGLFGLPCAAGIVASAEPLVATLLGPQWGPTVDLIRVLGVYALTSIAMANQGPILLAMGHSRLLTLLMALGVLLLVPSFIAGVLIYGLAGAVIATSAVNVVLFAVSLGVTARVVGVAPVAVFRVTWRAMLAAGVMGVSVWILADYLGARHAAPVLNLLVCVISGAIVYLAVLAGLWITGGRAAGPEQSAYAYFVQRLPRRAGGLSSTKEARK
jgi:lipopolysaccharide exporter